MRRRRWDTRGTGPEKPLDGTRESAIEPQRFRVACAEGNGLRPVCAKAVVRRIPVLYPIPLLYERDGTGMKKVAAFSTPAEAHVALTRLESAGIHAVVRDEFTVTFERFYSNANGGRK